jgi:hypothetical protein
MLGCPRPRIRSYLKQRSVLICTSYWGWRCVLTSSCYLNWKSVLISASVVLVVTSEKVCVLPNFSIMSIFHFIKYKDYSEKLFRLQEKYLHIFLSHTNYGPQPELHCHFYLILGYIPCELSALNSKEF